MTLPEFDFEPTPRPPVLKQKPAAKKGLSSAQAWVITAIIILVPVGYLAYRAIRLFNLYNEKTALFEVNKEKARRDAPTVSAARLAAEYTANEVKANGVFSGTWFHVQGVIDSIEVDILGDPFVTLQTRDNDFFRVQCAFDESASKQLAELKKGQEVRIFGKCDGKLGNVMMSNCELTP